MSKSASRLAAWTLPFLVLASACYAGQEELSTETWFICYVKGQPAGYLHMVAELIENKDAPVRFVYEAALRLDGKVKRATMRVLCRPARYLLPVQFTWEQESGEKREQMEFTIDWSKQQGGALRGSRDGKKFEKTLPANTLTGDILLSIVPQFPFKREQRFDCNLLHLPMLDVARDLVIIYIGKEGVDVGGRTQKLHRFEQQGSPHAPRTFWVNDAHELVRVDFGADDYFLRATKQKALSAIRGTAAAPGYIYVKHWGGPRMFHGAASVAVDAKDNIYVADHGNRRVVKFTSDGEFVREFGKGVLRSQVYQCAVDATGNVYVTDVLANRVVKFGPDGSTKRV